MIETWKQNNLYKRVKLITPINNSVNKKALLRLTGF